MKNLLLHKFQIPLEFGTGNYSIVSYTKCDGGDAVTEFDGKIISVFNTVTAKRVKDGVSGFRVQRLEFRPGRLCLPDHAQRTGGKCRVLYPAPVQGDGERLAICNAGFCEIAVMQLSLPL